MDHENLPEGMPEQLPDDWFERLLASVEPSDAFADQPLPAEPETHTEEPLPVPEQDAEEAPAAEPEAMAVQEAAPETAEPGEPADPAAQDSVSDEELEQFLRQTLAELPPVGETARQETQPAAVFMPAPLTEPETFKDDEFRDTFGEGDGLSQMFTDQPLPPLREEANPAPEQEPEQETKPEKKEPPEPKGRPKGKKGYGLLGIPHILATCVWLGIIVAIGLTIGRLAWVCASDVLAFGREEKLITVTIEETDDIDAIAQKLQESGLIRYADLFKLYAGLAVDDGEIVPGTYELNSLYDYHALVAMMSPVVNRYEEVEIQIPEGYTCAQIFRMLEEKGVCNAADLEEYAANGELDEHWFLEGVTRGDKYCLEGYLFPDTYKFYKNDEPERVLEKMLSNFDYRFTDAMEAKIDELNTRLADMMRANGYGEDVIAGSVMTIREVVIVASLIEKETANDLESYSISSVIYNRLADPRDYPYLNIDAALVYALGGKSDLTDEDLKLDNPYNTYIYAGLTPGAISNPGRASLEAALDPEETDYFFYALDPAQGAHHFSTTLAEHEDFLASLGGS